MEQEVCTPDCKKMVTDIHQTIVGSIDGKQKGVHERLNNLESFERSFKNWLKIVIGTAVTNVGVIITQFVVIFLKGHQ